MKRKRERESPWQMSWEALKVGERTPLTRIEKKDVETIEYIQWIRVGWKSNALRTSLRYCRLILSKVLDISSLMRIHGVLWSLRDWMSSWVRITLSRICQRSTYPFFSFEIRKERNGLRQLAKTLVMILKMTLQRVIGRKDFGWFEFSSLGMRVRKVALKVDVGLIKCI